MKKLIKILKFITPPILFHLINFIHFKLPIVNFRKYWIKSKYQFLKSSFENKDLVEATEMFVKSQSYKLVSNYWQSLNIKNYESILINGLDNYAHNIFTNYHTFLYFDNSLIDKSIENLNGVILDLFLFAFVWLYEGKVDTALAIAVSLVVVIIMAGLIGTFVPLFLDRRGIDPAIATGPFITTSNDIFGILIYFLIAKLILGI